jgi:hypothetical protein
MARLVIKRQSAIGISDGLLGSINVPSGIMKAAPLYSGFLCNSAMRRSLASSKRISINPKINFLIKKSAPTKKMIATAICWYAGRSRRKCAILCQDICFAFGHTPAIHSGWERNPNPPMATRSESPGKKNQQIEEPPVFTRENFLSLIQKASSTPFQKPAPKSRGKSNSRNRGDCT